MNRPRIGRAIVVLGALVLIAGGMAWHIWTDEARIGGVRPGMTEREVVSLVGVPTGRFQGITLTPILIPEDPSCRASITTCLAYERWFRQSFLVYLDSGGVVRCTKRMNVFALKPVV